jgi:hypothetical protein
LVLATGVLGTAISAYFQQRNWDYQKRADKIEKDATGTLTALEGLNAIVDDKFLTTYALDDAIKNRADSDKLTLAIAAFTVADKAWERQHQSLASTLEIVIDSQFGIDDLAATGEKGRLHALPARRPAAGRRRAATGPRPFSRSSIPARQSSSRASRRNFARDENGGAWPAEAAEPDPGRIVLGHLWRAQKVLQCLMVQRAVEIRGQPFGVSFLPFGKADGGTPYAMSEADRPREERCIAPYRDDRTFGTASLKST